MAQSTSSDPFATGGGGTLLEYKASAWFAKDILTGRETSLGDRLTAITLQPRGVRGFDDFRIEIGQPRSPSTYADDLGLTVVRSK